MKKIVITRSAAIPDRLRLARYFKNPELGPKILFFSGGTALNSLSRSLLKYTHNSIHLVTPFDSGGSSAKLRKAFNMLAVGDLRSRLMALADQTVKGNPEIFRLFAYRFPRDEDNKELKDKLSKMAKGEHSLVRSVHDPMRKIIRSHLEIFKSAMPEDFDLRGASIGNLILASGYFTSNRHIDPVIFIFSKLAEVRGIVRPIMNTRMHLVARLEDGSMVKGQHMLTGKEVPPITSPVRELFLSKKLNKPVRANPAVRDKIKKLILDAELICYPMGSFYSSIIANILPAGVGAAVSLNHCPKVYVPNTGHDPEQVGTTLDQRVEILITYLQKSCPAPVRVDSLLNFVVIDRDKSLYQGGVDVQKIKKLGVEVLETTLTQQDQKPYLTNQMLMEALFSMV
ncbi:GAK system CofD-like protein [Desulfonatronovibrio hydrogenovorans]|uniref:GAK system CofD-like protein n=1 Tax=Desulfonatronovibrio hydrogenovorans TaxID=53245 RepID=UPI000490D543|nr:GAK system CofD-like protein [Desulfonatronovibrio hydrogenovorans]